METNSPVGKVNLTVAIAKKPSMLSFPFNPLWNTLKKWGNLRD